MKKIIKTIKYFFVTIGSVILATIILFTIIFFYTANFYENTGRRSLPNINYIGMTAEEVFEKVFEIEREFHHNMPFLLQLSYNGKFELVKGYGYDVHLEQFNLFTPRRAYYFEIVDDEVKKKEIELLKKRTSWGCHRRRSWIFGLGGPIPWEHDWIIWLRFENGKVIEQKIERDYSYS